MKGKESYIVLEKSYNKALKRGKESYIVFEKSNKANPRRVDLT